jgi:predicted nucleotidyltransferase
MSPQIPIDYDKIAVYCRKNHIRRLALFGSVLRDDFGLGSDVDVLVEFEPGQLIGQRFIEIERELSEIFGGRKVDLITPKFLNHLIRDQVLASAEMQYAEGRLVVSGAYARYGQESCVENVRHQQG